MYNVYEASHIPGAPRGLKDQLLHLCQEPPRITRTWHFRWGHRNFDGFISFFYAISENGCLPFVPERQHSPLLLVFQGHPKRYTGTILNLAQSEPHAPISSCGLPGTVKRCWLVLTLLPLGPGRPMLPGCPLMPTEPGGPGRPSSPGAPCGIDRQQAGKLSSKHGSVLLATWRG